MCGYMIKADSEKTARSIGKELPISPKCSVEVCRKLKGMSLQAAIEYLNRVVEMKEPVPFKRYVRYMSHRKGRGFGSGRYPVKTAKAILKVLEDVENNAQYKALDPDEMKIIHIASSRGRVYRGWMPRAHGRSSPWNNETVNIEVIVEEMEEA